MPVFVFSLPISFSVSTVMETEVAENTEPIKADFSRLYAVNSPPQKKTKYSPPQRSRGVNTPSTAITLACTPVSFSSFMSVSMPAVNISMITPISAALTKKSVLSSTPKPLGPMMMPASRAPTTWGRWTCSVSRPKTLVDSRMTAKSSK